MYLYRNNFANIGNNGAVVPENFFFRTSLLFSRLFVISFQIGFCHLLKQLIYLFFNECFVPFWLKMPHCFIKFIGGQTDATQQMMSKVYLNLRFRSAKHFERHCTFWPSVAKALCYAPDIFLLIYFKQ